MSSQWERQVKGIGTEKPMRDMQTETEGGGQSEKTWVREKVRESINHSYAPVRVASGTNRNHMQLDNIPNLRLAGQVHSKTSSSSPQSSHNPPAP